MEKPKQAELFPESKRKSYQGAESMGTREEALRQAELELVRVTQKLENLENLSERNYFKGSEKQKQALSKRKEDLEKIVAGIKTMMGK